MKFPIKKLLQKIPTLRIYGDIESQIEGLSQNSVKLQKNEMFIARRGSQFDSHQLLFDQIDSIENPVICCNDDFFSENKVQLLEKFKSIITCSDTKNFLGLIAAHFYNHPSKKLKLIGITGTNGKTTLTYFLESIFNHAGFSTGIIGTINFRYLNKIIPTNHTTPDPITLQKTLFEMVGEGIELVFMEVSSHGIVQKRVEELDFDCTLFTNLTQDHLDFHSNLEEYFQAKNQLFQNLLISSTKKNKAAIINEDDPYGKKIIRELNSQSSSNDNAINILPYGFGRHKGPFHLKDYSLTLNNTNMILQSQEGEFEFHSSIIGKHNLSNILAAITCSNYLNLSLDQISKGLRQLKSIPGRMELVSSRNQPKVFVDYAHTPDALKNVLTLLNELKEKDPFHILTLFGCGGDRDSEKRPQMGNIAFELSDFLIITSDNPRTEDPKRIMEDIKKGIPDSNKVVYQVDRKKAIQEAIKKMTPRDVLLMAGKGHEDYQIIGQKKLPFSDLEIAQKVLNKYF